MIKYPKKILIISGIYPTKKSPQLGSFIKESVDTLNSIRKTKFYFSVAKKLPFNNILVFFKHLRILIKSFYVCIIHRPHFIIAHTLFPTGFVALLVAKIFNTKIVIFAHGGDVYGMSKKRAVLWQTEKKMNILWKVRFYLIKRVIHEANGIIYVSDYLFDLAKKYFKAKKNKSLISPIGYNPTIFYQFKNYEERSKTILYVGRIDEKKGIYKLFNMLSSISDFLNEINYSVKIIGRIDDRKFFDVYDKQKKLYNLEYLGEKDRVELPELFNSSKITIVPSYYESLGLVAIESLACGTPVACYPVGGLKDIIVENYNGIFLNIRDDVESSRKLMGLLKDRDVLKKYSINSKTSVKKYNIFETHNKNIQFINRIYKNK